MSLVPVLPAYSSELAPGVWLTIKVTVLPDLAAEVAWSRREKGRLRMGRDILKNAALIFGATAPTPPATRHDETCSDTSRASAIPAEAEGRAA